jgi:hypothetical protein
MLNGKNAQHSMSEKAATYIVPKGDIGRITQSEQIAFLEHTKG